jgi:hypothetical protein
MVDIWSDHQLRSEHSRYGHLRVHICHSALLQHHSDLSQISSGLHEVMGLIYYDSAHTLRLRADSMTLRLYSPGLYTRPAQLSHRSVAYDVLGPAYWIESTQTFGRYR